MADTESRPIIAAKLKGPGPAKYQLPGTTGFILHDATRKKMPAFSFGKRFKEKYESCTPGPAYMMPQYTTRKGKAQAPAYSLYGRQMERNNNKYPSPGQYSPEKYPIPHQKRAPSYSFGGRFRDNCKDKSPAPNTYKLPSLFGTLTSGVHSAPAHSIAGRPKIGAYYEDVQKTPGPGTYTVCNPNTYLRRGPAYSIKGRHDQNKDQVIVPGPGAYKPEMVWLNRKTAPSFSFGVRHTEYITLLQDDPPVVLQSS